jgi:Uma2 family endonuclease
VSTRPLGHDVAMSIQIEWPATGHPLTVDALDRMPEDGRRYELLAGALIVSPWPDGPHQEVALRLGAQLRVACPPDLRVVQGPSVVLSRETQFEPDIAVISQAHVHDAKLTQPPLLIVEVRPPGTALVALDRKKAAYQAFGLPSYWTIDPDPDRPELTVFELGPDGTYGQAGRVAGTTPFPAVKPFAAEIVPARLVAGLHPR